MSGRSIIGWAKQLQTKTLYIFICAVLGFNGLGLAAPLLTAPVAAAANGDVWITAAMANPIGTDTEGEYVVLTNQTAADISLVGWTFDDGGSNHATLSGAIAAHGTYKLCVQATTYVDCNQEWSGMSLNNGGDTLTLTDGTAQIDQVTYTSSAVGVLNQFSHTAAALSAIAASLGAEEFVTVDGSYKGISVGFNAKDFSGVNSVTVDMLRSDGTHAAKHGTADLFSLIDSNTAPYQFTVPFVIQPGSYDPATDTFWTSDVTTWTAASVPASVTITITDANGTKTVTNSNFLQNDASHPAYLGLLPPPATTVTVTPTNTQGWVFNGDPSTATPYEFSTAEHSIGSGSLYVPPIGSNASDKFIASKTLDIPTSDLTAVSYDFLVAGNGTSASADQYYLNVYTKLAGSTAYYNCRFDYAPATSSTSFFTTASFNKASAPVSVGDRANDNFTCPTTLGGMPAGSTVSFIALNVGDTSANDTGLAGYLDKVVISTASAITTYDFEPEPTPPAGGHGGGGTSTPATGRSNGGFVLGAVSSNNSAAVSQGSTNEGEVLSDSTELPTTTTAPTEVKTDTSSKDHGTKNTKGATDKPASCSKLAGLCWYWWIPIVIGIAAIVYWFIRSADTNNTTTSGR